MIGSYLLLALAYAIALGIPFGLGFWFGYARGRSTLGERPEQAHAQKSAEVAKP